MPSHRPASRFVRLARACNRHRWRTFAAWLLAVVAIQVVAAQVGKEEISSYRLPGTESQRALDLLTAHFPAVKGDADQMVFAVRDGRLDDPAVRGRVDSALARVARQPAVAGVTGPFSPGGQLTGDGRVGVATVAYRDVVDRLEPQVLVGVEEAAFASRGAGLRVEHGGPGAEVVRFSEGGDPSELVGVVLAGIVLLMTFGSLIAAGLPLIAAMLALGTALGAIGLISHLVDTPDFAAQLATLIGLGVGIDYALIVVTRYRTEVRAGLSRDTAIERAIDTAGRTVAFAGATVVIALLGLFLLGLRFMHGVALGAAVAVLTTMLAALTVVPALIGGAGGFLDGVLPEVDRRGGVRVIGTRLRLPLPGRARRARRAQRRVRRQDDGAGWARWSRGVQRHPWLATGVALGILLGLALPAADLRLGSSDAGVDPPGSTTRNAYELIAEGFGAGTNGPLTLVARLAEPGDRDAARRIATMVGEDHALRFVSAPALSPDGRVATVSAAPRTGPQEAATARTLARLREDVMPRIERATGARVEIGGLTAATEDFNRVLAGKLPLFVGVVVLLSALLLMAVFRSLVVPLKAAAMNGLSIGAALGLVTLVFQDGVGAGVLGIGTGPIEAFLPVLMFAIVFGLSMDYEVFLLSRMHEAWTETGDASVAVTRGIGSTGRVITAAASIMVLVFGAFALSDDRVSKLFAVGLAAAVLIDAVVIRCLLVPAVMELLGRRAWWLPEWLDRRLPRLAIEAPGRPGPDRVERHDWGRGWGTPTMPGGASAAKVELVTDHPS